MFILSDEETGAQYVILRQESLGMFLYFALEIFHPNASVLKGVVKRYVKTTDHTSFYKESMDAMIICDLQKGKAWHYGNNAAAASIKVMGHINVLEDKDICDIIIDFVKLPN